MNILKIIFFVLTLSLVLSATITDDIVYIEKKNEKNLSLKDEFLNPGTKYYTLAIATFKSSNFDINEFSKIYNLTNVVAYRYGKNKEFIRILSGLYETGTLAQNDIRNLHFQLQKNKPYSSKLFRHQENFEKYRNRKNLVKKEINSSIYVEDTKEAKSLKSEFLNRDSKYYSIAIGTIDLDKDSIKNFFKVYNVSDKALVHAYGKNRDKARVIYGLYKTRKEALEAISSFNKNLKSNAPFAMKMKKFQSFYLKSFPDGLEDESIVELKINDKKDIEKSVVPKISDEIEILKPEKIIKPDLKREFEEEKKKDDTKKPKKVEKAEKKEPKKIKKKTENLDKNRFIKHSQIEDVYFIESNGSFNILNEVFLNDNSSFYTVDLGELDLSKTTIEGFFLKNKMKDDALAYKYGENKEFARAIYGAFETREKAKEIAKKFNISSTNLKVSNIKKHQKLYKEFHQKNLKIEHSKSLKSDIIYGNENLKEEFIDKNTNSYTITLITFLKDEIDLETFLIKNNLKEDVLIYSLGSTNNYYRILYKSFNNYQEAEDSIEELNFSLKLNAPFVSKIRTQQRKFESYNNRKISNQSIQKLELKN